MMATETDILDWFQTRGHRARLVRHAATPRAADGRAARAALAGVQSKSLLVADKSGRLVLVMARSDIRADLKGVGRALDCRGRLSFASPDVMQETLGVGPGHLSPLALINDKTKQVATVVVDQGLLAGLLIWCHPLHNEASVGLEAAGLFEFIRAHGPAPTVLDVASADRQGDGNSTGCSGSVAGPDVVPE
ncbi:MAG: YbaK/EbsC family protein [Parvularcula sp.]